MRHLICPEFKKKRKKEELYTDFSLLWTLHITMNRLSLDWRLTRPQLQLCKLTYSFLTYFMSAFEPPLCALVLVFRVKKICFSFTFCWVQQYWTSSVVFEYLSHRRLQKTEARIDYKWDSFKLQIYMESLSIAKKMFLLKMSKWKKAFLYIFPRNVLLGSVSEWRVILCCNCKKSRQMRGVTSSRLLIMKPCKPVVYSR